jgi:hypothetical protein
VGNLSIDFGHKANHHNPEMRRFHLTHLPPTSDVTLAPSRPCASLTAKPHTFLLVLTKLTIPQSQFGPLEST